MSKISFQPNAVGSGTFTIASPNSGTNRTLTLPDETGTVLTTAGVPSSAMPAGSVLQVVSYLTATQGSQTMTTSDQIINNITKVITPLGANSKFLVTVRWFGEVNAAWNIPFNIHMDGVRVNINGQGRAYGLVMAAQSYGVADNDSSTPETVNMTTLVSTSSVVGTAITFSLVADADNGAHTLWNNRCFSGSGTGTDEAGTSEMIITEIGG